MKDFRQIFDGFRQHPAMYVGEKSLDAIQQFLSGYSIATKMYDVGDAADRFLFSCNEFNGWVACRLHIHEGTSGWCRMIRSKTASEDDAIARFFELLDEFRNRTPHLVARLVGFKKTYEQVTYRKEDGKNIADKTEILSYPDSIRFVTYTDDPGFFAYPDTEVEFSFIPSFFTSVQEFESHNGAIRDNLQIIDPNWICDHLTRLKKSSATKFPTSAAMPT